MEHKQFWFASRLGTRAWITDKRDTAWRMHAQGRHGNGLDLADDITLELLRRARRSLDAHWRLQQRLLAAGGIRHVKFPLTTGAV